jgi:DNA adenine methylase
MRTLKGKGIVSLNDHPDIRQAFGGLQMEEVEIEYLVGGAHNRSPRRELIIYSWDRAAEPAGLF